MDCLVSIPHRDVFLLKEGAANMRTFAEAFFNPSEGYCNGCKRISNQGSMNQFFFSLCSSLTRLNFPATLALESRYAHIYRSAVFLRLPGLLPFKLEKANLLSFGKLLSAHHEEEKVASEPVQLELPMFEQENRDSRDLDSLQDEVENAILQVSTPVQLQPMELVTA